MKYLVFSLFLISAIWALPTSSADTELLEPAAGLDSGMLAVVNKSDNSISVIDIASQKIVKTLATGVGPHELVISNDGRLAVSTDFVGGDSLTVFDLKRLEVLRRISLKTLPGPHGIQFLEDNEHVVFTSGKAQAVGVVDVQSGSLVKTIATKQNTTHMLTYCNDDSTLYATNIRSHSISVLDLESGQKTKDISTEAMPEAIRCHKASGNIWYGANKDGKLLVVEPSTETVLASWDGFEFPYRVLFNHDESIAVVPDFSKHYVRFFNTKDNTEIGTLVLEQEAGPQGIALHPEKDIAFLSLNLQNKIVAIDIATQQVIAQYPTGNNPDGIIFFNRDTL